MSVGRRARRQLWRLAVLLVVAVVAAVWRAAAPVDDAGPGTAPPGATPSAGWTVTHVVDGDTVEVARDGVTERVRLLGIDTPERGECGYAEARDAAAGLVEGREVTLVVGSSDDRDRYGRLLRFVEVAADGADVDLGLRQLELGLAAEAYDSRSGYPRHDREDAYAAADEAAPDVCPDLDVH